MCAAPATPNRAVEFSLKPGCGWASALAGIRLDGPPCGMGHGGRHARRVTPRTGRARAADPTGRRTGLGSAAFEPVNAKYRCGGAMGAATPARTTAGSSLNSPILLRLSLIALAFEPIELMLAAMEPAFAEMLSAFAPMAISFAMMLPALVVM